MSEPKTYSEIIAEYRRMLAEAHEANRTTMALLETTMKQLKDTVQLVDTVSKQRDEAIALCKRAIG